MPVDPPVITTCAPINDVLLPHHISYGVLCKCPASGPLVYVLGASRYAKSRLLLAATLPAGLMQAVRLLLHQ